MTRRAPSRSRSPSSAAAARNTRVGCTYAMVKLTCPPYWFGLVWFGGLFFSTGSTVWNPQLARRSMMCMFFTEMPDSRGSEPPINASVLFPTKSGPMHNTIRTKNHQYHQGAAASQSRLRSGQSARAWRKILAYKLVTISIFVVVNVPVGSWSRVLFYDTDSTGTETSSHVALPVATVPVVATGGLVRHCLCLPR
jgi:hypothetical protein